jgi:protein TonB
VLLVPTEIPTEIAPESGIDFSEDAGVEGGVEGGVPGGVLGGALGGIVTEAPPPPPEPAKPLRIGGDVQPPALIHYVAPEYPEEAVWTNTSGMVILEAAVDERGEVLDVKVLRSIKLLDQAAMDAVRQWRYKPVLLNGRPHPFILTVTVSFSLVTKKPGGR